MARILVIEDEMFIRDEVMTWLELEGYDVLGADNGKDGLDLIYNENPDLVLCDINMPEMDGHEVLIELRSNMLYAQLPFIFLTATADHNAMREGMNLGADDYITKPFTYAEVLSAIRTRLTKQQQLNSQIEQLSHIIEEERQLRLLKSHLMGMFSHDFRNPLATILAASNMLQSYWDRLTPEKREQRFNHIEGSVHLLLQMLDEMLMVAEIENGQLTYNPQATDLTKLIEKIIGDFLMIDADKHIISSYIQLPERIMIDQKIIQHILTNLISNALKYSPIDTEIIVKASFKSDQFTLLVKDAGIGIPQEDIANIFEPYFRASNVESAKGTGLGLALVMHTLDVCHGTIEVSSELEHGTSFTVRILSQAV